MTYGDLTVVTVKKIRIHFSCSMLLAGCEWNQSLWFYLAFPWKTWCTQMLGCKPCTKEKCLATKHDQTQVVWWPNMLMLNWVAKRYQACLITIQTSKMVDSVWSNVWCPFKRDPTRKCSVTKQCWLCLIAKHFLTGQGLIYHHIKPK